MTQPIPSLPVLKRRAQQLRERLALEGETISHGKALERVAHMLGHRNWNTLRAMAGNGEPGPPATLGARVSGRYLGQPFTGTVLGVQSLQHQRSHRVTIHFDEPVDVVEFDSFSAFRQRVTSSLNAEGRTANKTSNGRPIMELDL
jgi:hypothetical protein